MDMMKKLGAAAFSAAAACTALSATVFAEGEAAAADDTPFNTKRAILLKI